MRRVQTMRSDSSESGPQVVFSAGSEEFGGTEQSRLSRSIRSVNESVKVVLRSRTATAGLAVCVAVAVIAIFAPIIGPYDPNKQDLPGGFMPPSASHPLGTDEFGRDVLSRIVWGSRISLRVGIVGVAIAVVIGVPVGLVAGYFGGKIEALALAVTDMFLAFPLILLTMALVAFLGFSLHSVTLAVGVALAPTYVRLVRSSALSVKQQEYILAARAVGVGGGRILLRHFLPNVLAPIIVMSTLNVAWVILVEGALSFLGIGVPPPTATWGSIVGDGRGYLRNAPWISTFGGLAISITILGLNLFGDGLRDALDPTIRRRPGA